MSKFNKYAVRLDKAFREARMQYEAALAELKATDVATAEGF